MRASIDRKPTPLGRHPNVFTATSPRTRSVHAADAWSVAIPPRSCRTSTMSRRSRCRTRPSIACDDIVRSTRPVPEDRPVPGASSVTQRKSCARSAITSRQTKLHMPVCTSSRVGPSPTSVYAIVWSPTVSAWTRWGHASSVSQSGRSTRAVGRVRWWMSWSRQNLRWVDERQEGRTTRRRCDIAIDVTIRRTRTSWMT